MVVHSCRFLSRARFTGRRYLDGNSGYPVENGFSGAKAPLPFISLTLSLSLSSRHYQISQERQPLTPNQINQARRNPNPKRKQPCLAQQSWAIRPGPAPSSRSLPTPSPPSASPWPSASPSSAPPGNPPACSLTILFFFFFYAFSFQFLFWLFPFV